MMLNTSPYGKKNLSGEALPLKISRKKTRRDMIDKKCQKASASSFRDTSLKNKNPERDKKIQDKEQKIKEYQKEILSVTNPNFRLSSSDSENIERLQKLIPLKKIFFPFFLMTGKDICQAFGKFQIYQLWVNGERLGSDPSFTLYQWLSSYTKTLQPSRLRSILPFKDISYLKLSPKALIKQFDRELYIRSGLESEKKPKSITLFLGHLFVLLNTRSECSIAKKHKEFLSFFSELKEKYIIDPNPAESCFFNAVEHNFDELSVILIKQQMINKNSAEYIHAVLDNIYPRLLANPLYQKNIPSFPLLQAVAFKHFETVEKYVLKTLFHQEVKNFSLVALQHHTCSVSTNRQKVTHKIKYFLCYGQKNVAELTIKIRIYPLYSFSVDACISNFSFHRDIASDCKEEIRSLIRD